MDVKRYIRLLLALAGALLFTLFIPDQDGTSGLSLFPPAAAILVAVATGRLILGLGLAILGGALISPSGLAA